MQANLLVWRIVQVLIRWVLTLIKSNCYVLGTGITL